VFGLPLALFGFIAYTSMAIFAIAPLLINAPEKKELREQVEATTGMLLWIGATSMLVFSGYLMYLLAFEIKAVCVYCVASALFSATLFILAIIGREWQDRGQIFFSGIITVMVALVGTLAVYADINSPKTEALGYAVTTASGESEVALAKHLTQVGAKFYGAFWCPHCQDQKTLFGKEAAKQIPYVECSTPDRQAQTEVCKAQNIQGYPTWVINGQASQGTKTLDQLADLTGYQGSRNFKNVLNEN
jgi:uncharacterized membrane protein/glutaredoxin